MRVNLNESISLIKQFRRGMNSDHKPLARTMRGLVTELVEAVITPLSRAAGVPITFKLGRASRPTKRAPKRRRARKQRRVKSVEE